MSWLLITGWFWLMAGIGVAIALDIRMAREYPTRWSGVTRTIGRGCFVLFWPIVLVTIITLVLIATADG